MANGQAVLASALLDVAEATRLESRMESRELDRHRSHGAQLMDALDLERVYAAARMQLQVPAVLALTWHCSEHLANARLHEAHVLNRLGALVVMADGLLTVEQGRVVVDVLGSVPDPVADAVWARLHRRLEQDAVVGAVLPPARAAELLRRWLIEADPQGAVDRRRDEEEHSADVDLLRRGDGLVDVAIRGVSGPNAQAVGDRIREHADPIGPDDRRPIGMRMRDAAVDLILGRATLPFSPQAAEAAAALGLARCGQGGCGCAQGQSVPCGIKVQVLVPVDSALGTADAPAELVGFGPIEADHLAELLLAAPTLTRVWIDPDTGTPVAIDEPTWTPARGDPVALRRALLDIAGGAPPGETVPMHPNDHPLSAVPDGLHPPGTPGPYVVPRRLRRLLQTRAPRCEWPGCGRRAVTGAGSECDIDHDLAWPHGATCGCNAGPLCRRHHRVKQEGWTKERRPGGHVRWTSPLGRRWLSWSQHEPPPVATRSVPPVPAPDPRWSRPDEGLDGRAALPLRGT